MKLWLGVHEPAWLARTNVGLMVSHRRLARRFKMPRAVGPWVLDSGGFTELTMHGEWRTTTATYVQAVRRYRDEIGSMVWAAPQDWMVEPAMLARTGLTVADHQQRTVDNYRQLLDMAPDVPWLPVLQGWTLDDYLRCTGRYVDVGVDLLDAPLVGLGSVCRRQHTTEAATIIRRLAGEGLTLHGFGLKLGALDRTADVLGSVDSMAWSVNARNRPPLPGCTHQSCANCLRYALRWRAKVERRATVPTLWDEAA